MTTDSPQDSLQHYFDDLLFEEPAVAVQKIQPKPMVEVKSQVETDYQERLREKEVLAKRKLAKLLSSTPKTVPADVETIVKEELKAEPLVEVEVEDVEESSESLLEVESAVADPREVMLESLQWLENGRPRWAQERFDVLLFSVSGLTLAVPLIALGQIQPLTDELTPLFGQIDWFMGLQPTPVGKIRTVNTAKFVMPERYDDAFLQSARYVISIDGLPWGLAVDEVNQPITLEPEDVKWRSERSKRAWLAGTVKQHMCALIDIPMMGRLLEDEDHAKKI